MSGASISAGGESRALDYRSVWGMLAARPLVPVLIFMLLLLALSPVGYQGGGLDDWHYLEAARCAAEQGFCVPHDHWWRRFPLVVPTGAMLALFGESRAALWIAPLAYSLAAIGFFVVVVQRQFGRSEALLAGLILIATPIMSEHFLDLNIDIPELAFIAAAVFCLQSACLRGGSGWSTACGIMLALAVEARPTSLALLPLFLAAHFLIPGGRRRLPPFVVGFALTLALEAAVYFLWVGDPLYPWQLSLGHTRIPSTELAATVDLSQSPLFNIAYIDGWRRAMGISVHWTIDALINLLAHPAIGLTLVGAIAFIGLNWRWLAGRQPAAKTLLFLLAAAVLLFGALVYGFAIDPKPRMFLPLAAVASVCVAVLAVQSWRDGKRLIVIACVGLILVKGAIASYDNRLSLQGAAELAPRWIADEHGGLAVEERTARFLTLVPEVRRLARYRGGEVSGLLLVGGGNCRHAGAEAGLGGGWRVRRAQMFEPSEPRAIAALRRQKLFFSPQGIPVMCILSRS